MSIRAAYLGHLNVNGMTLPVTSMGSHVEGSILFYDPVVGIRDTCVVSGTKGDGGDASWGTTQNQRRTFRNSPQIGKVKFGGPVFTSGGPPVEFLTLLSCAANAATMSGSTCFWYGGDGHDFDGGFITSFGLSVNAGGSASYTCEITAKNMTPRTGSAAAAIDCSKIVTWDTCGVTSSLLSSYSVEGLSLNIANPPQPVYTAANNNPSGDLFPADLRLGIQDVTGSVSIYGFQSFLETDVDTLQVSIGDASFALYVTYAPSTTDTTSGSIPVICSIPFHGANASGGGMGGPVWLSLSH